MLKRLRAGLEPSCIDVVDFVAATAPRQPECRVRRLGALYLMLAGNLVAGWQMARMRC